MGYRPLFSLGELYITPGAIEAFNATGESVSSYLERHVTGDWSEMDEFDQEQNRQAVTEGYRVVSAYRLSNGTKIWIITEADRSVTTVLLPEEY